MSTLQDFILASASYFGIPAEQIMDGSTIDASQGDFDVVLRVSLTPDDLKGVAGRMATMLLDRKADEAVAFSAPAEAGPPDGMLREAYGNLTKAERSRHGSFARFKAYAQTGIRRDVVGEVPAPVQAGLAPGEALELPVRVGLDLPAHVWFEGSQLTEQQKMLSVGRDTAGLYAMAPEDLTDEQRAQVGLEPLKLDIRGLE